MRFDIKSVQPKERRIVFKITESGGTPTLAYGQHQLTITDQGVGDYLVTLVEAGVQSCLALLTSARDGRVVRVGTCTKTSVQVLVDDDSGTAAEGDVIGEILCFDSLDQL